MRLNNTTQFKELIGKEIICVPTGNEARGRVTKILARSKMSGGYDYRFKSLICHTQTPNLPIHTLPYRG
jgi:hypothetical protein